MGRRSEKGKWTNAQIDKIMHKMKAIEENRVFCSECGARSTGKETCDRCGNIFPRGLQLAKILIDELFTP
eukprot:g81916.t1